MTSTSSIIGYITHISPIEVKGFALSGFHENSIEVKLICNGKCLARQMATLPSKFLTDKQLRSNHGFSFNLRSLGFFHILDELEVHVDDVALPHTPYLSLTRLKQGHIQKSNQDLTFFMHIQKTAGTSLRMMLYKQFDQAAIWPNKADLSENGGKYPHVQVLKDLSKDRKLNTNLIMGHFPLWAIRHMPVRPKVITFLRQPQSQMISLAYHLYSQEEYKTDISLLEIIADIINHNPQTYFFLPAHIPTTKITQESFELACRNLESCDFVGIQERFKEGIEILEKKFGWSMGRQLTKNKGKSPKISNEIIQLIDQKTYWDRKLYTVACQKFETLRSGDNKLYKWSKDRIDNLNDRF